VGNTNAKDPGAARATEELWGASKLREATGLTYRQISDWDDRGLLPHAPRQRGGWRGFTSYHIFAIRIIADLRRGFGIPLERLKPVLHWMLGGTSGELDYHVHLKKNREWLLRSARQLITDIDDLEWPEPGRTEFLRLASAPLDFFDLESGNRLLPYVLPPYGRDGRVKQAITQILMATNPILYLLLRTLAGNECLLFTDLKATFSFVDVENLRDLIGHVGNGPAYVVFPVVPSIGAVAHAVDAEELSQLCATRDSGLKSGLTPEEREVANLLAQLAKAPAIEFKTEKQRASMLRSRIGIHPEPRVQSPYSGVIVRKPKSSGTTGKRKPRTHGPVVIRKRDKMD